MEEVPVPSTTIHETGEAPEQEGADLGFDADLEEPDVVIEGSSGPTVPLPPSNKRRTRPSLRLVSQSGNKKQKTEIGAKAKLDGFKKREIAKGMAVDISWLVDNSGETLVNLIKEQGWETLFGEKYKNLIYQNELAEFYCHLSVEDDVCTTLVKGEGIEFDASTLGEILGVPAIGYAIHSKKGVPLLDYANVEDLVAMYSQDICTTASSFHQDALSPFHKLVYNLVRRSVVPRAQKRTNVELLDVIYMDLLVTGKQINFPLLMIRHMAYMQSGHNFSLPYAPLITTILEHFQVPLKSVGKPIGPGDVLGKVALENLGVEIQNGEFIFTKAEKREVGTSHKISSTPKKQAKEQGTSSQGALSATLLSVLHDFRKEMHHEFIKLHDRIDTIDRRSGAVVIQVDGLKREVTRLRESTTVTTASLATTLVRNHAAVLKKLEEFEGATVEQEVKEEEEPPQEQDATTSQDPTTIVP